MTNAPVRATLRPVGGSARELEGVPAVPAGHVAAPYLSALHARWLAEDPARHRREFDASLLFADISGFTAMSERLAKLGKVGAEELQAAINQVFARLLAVVEAQGGDVVKFGGDALFVLFPREGHEQRAAACALGMQDALRPLRRLRTEAGTVTLKMSCGVAAGTVHVVLAGRRFREVLVLGPTVTRMARLEGDAASGQVLVDARIARALPPRSAVPAAADGLPGAFLLRSVPPGLAGTPLVRRAGEDPRPGLPVHLRERHAADGEHRTVCVTFIQARGTDTLLATEGPDAVLAAVDAFLTAAQEAAERYDITFLDTDVGKDGCKALLVAGAPTAHADDPDRLVLAARDVVAAAPPGLRVRAGANRARLFTGDVGVATRRAYTTTGDGMNLAARVMGKAADGQVLATRALAERLSAPFELEPVEPFAAKGKSALVEASVVGPPRAARRRLLAPSGEPLLGREAELDRLEEALARSAESRGGAVQVVGEPGIGKSRLLEAVVTLAEDRELLALEGAPYGIATSYLPLRAGLRELLGGEDPVAALRELAAGDPELEPWLALLGPALGVALPETAQTADLAPEFRAARLHEVAGRLLDRLWGDRPALVLVEDAHWLDDATAALVGALAERAATRPWLVVAGRRDAGRGLRLDPGEDHVEELALGPIDVAASRELLRRRSLTAEGLEEAQVAVLVERAQGNPLFLAELLAAVQAGGSLHELPETVEGLVGARIDTLGTEERRLLRHASVLGARFAVDLLEATLDGPLDRGALDRLDGFLVDDGPGRLRFRHALLRDTAYEALPFRRRRELHLRAGRELERRHAADPGEVAELLSLHFHAARRWDASWRWSREAGDRARRLGAPADAAVLLQRALEAKGSGAQAAAAEGSKVAEDLGDCRQLAGQYAEAAQAYRVARRLAGEDRVRQAELCRKEGFLREFMSEPSQGLAWYTRGRRLLEPLGEDRQAQRTRARLAVDAGRVRLRQGRYHEAIRLIEPAVAVLRGADDRAMLARAYTLLDWAYTDLGTPLEHLRTAALPIYEELEDHEGQAVVLNNLGLNAVAEGHWPEALVFFERAIAARRRIGDVVVMAATQVNVAEVLVRQGRLAEAEELAREALRGCRPSKIAVGVVLSILGHAVARQMRLHEGAALLREAIGVLTETGSAPPRMDAEGMLAECLVSGGRVEAADELVHAGLDAVDLGFQQATASGLHRVAAFGLAQRGRPDEARERLDRALELARDGRSDYEACLALQARAELRDRLGEDAEDDRRQAAVLAARIEVVRLPRLPLG
jgi:class 3 adenylate cyclase/tetratricopeptide (TPR) repeat protein